MKKTDWAILITTGAYSFLFYHQNAGVNFLLFTLLLSGFFIYVSPKLLKTKIGALTIGLCILTAFFIVLYGSSLAILANIASLLILAAISVNDRSSVIFSLFFSVYSIVGALIFWIVDLVNSLQQKTERVQRNNSFKALTYVIPILLALIFFFIYKNANPLFEKYTEEFNLDFISGEWLLFTIGGFLLCLGLIRHQRVEQIDNWENNLPLTISRSETETKWNENRSVIILFVLLNLMLISINFLDINYLYLGAGMPKGLTHKQFVHNGVGTLILSILMGIVIILYSFRGELNFNEKSKWAKYLIFAWIIQNLFMVVSTAIRNNIYIEDALLTYKRIGVYYWLFMAACGLISTYVKVLKIKSAWYLFRTNSLIAYFVLALNAGIDWDKCITDHNLSHSKLLASLDKRYLVAISEVNIPQLYEIRAKQGFNIDSVYHYNHLYSYYSNSKNLDHKLYDFMKDQVRGDWRSYNCRRETVLKGVMALNDIGKIDSLDLSRATVHTLKPLYTITNLKKLNLIHTGLESFSELMHFKKLEILSIDYVNKRDAIFVGALTQLKYLYIMQTDGAIIKRLQKALPNTKVIVLPVVY